MLTPQRWSAIKQTFLDALEQPTGERLRWLSQQGCDAELQDTVAAMLTQHVDSQARTVTPFQPPAHIGPYRIAATVANTPGSLVLRGERDDGEFAQSVAIKILHGPALSAAQFYRFHQERHALASLQHPNICRLLDSRQLPSGHPYLVLEWIDGVPLLIHADGLSERSRLLLFRELCLAVEAAHQRLIVHRDLKPAHALVTANGYVKVLDFGIAKILDNAEVDSWLTQPGHTPLTPAYASPEQWREEPAHPAMDVFALGVILFELLTGAHPFGATPAGPHEWADRIRNGTPRTLRDAVPKASRDLDAITAMAIASDTSRRYTTVTRLREDIEAYLDQRPVLARFPTFRYRAKLWLTRHRAFLLPALLILALMFQAGLQFRQQQRQRMDDSRKARERAEALAVEAFGAILNADLPVATRKQILDIAAKEMESIDLAKVPDTELYPTARVMKAIGAHYGEGFDVHLDDPAKGALFTQNAVHLMERNWKTQPSEIAAEGYIEVLTQHGDVLFTAREYEKAIDIYRRIVVFYEDYVKRARPSRDMYLANTVAISMIGDALLAQGRPLEALAVQRDAVARRRGYATPGIEHYLANGLFSLAQCHEALRDREAALRTYRESERNYRASLASADPPFPNVSQHNLAQILESLAKLEPNPARAGRLLDEARSLARDLCRRYPANATYKLLAARLKR